MKLFKKFEYFKESVITNKIQIQNEVEKPKTIYKSTNLVQEICVAMVLLNNEFLDNLLDKGLKARYSENSQVFLTDLKNILMAKNRLQLGKFQDNKFIEDEDISKINGLFESVDFSIEEDWNQLIEARTIARNIIDKLLMTEKLESSLIRKIFWLGPNKSKEASEDIVIETNYGKQFGFYLNKNLSTSKTSSFLSLADDLIGDEVENLFGEKYIQKWNKLVQNWIRICYQYSNEKIKAYFEKFIQPSRINDIEWFEYFDIKHNDPKFKNLGEYLEEFDKNIVLFSDFLNQIWENRSYTFNSVEAAEKDWSDKKSFLLNSKILENLLTSSILKNNPGEVKKLDSNFKLSSGKLKMKLTKAIVEKLGCSERDVYFLANKGNSFYVLPSREFFREFYEDIEIKFDYHVKLIERTEEDNNFKIKLLIELDENKLMDCVITVKFSGGELSSKLSSTFKFEPADNFNFLLIEKMKKTEI